MATIISPDTRPQMSTVRPGVMKALPIEPGRKAEVVPLKVNIRAEDRRLAVMELKKDLHRRVNLTDARIIVSREVMVSDPRRDSVSLRNSPASWAPRWQAPVSR
jgi:electron transfer flavoprotein alpha subunit